MAKKDSKSWEPRQMASTPVIEDLTAAKDRSNEINKVIAIDSGESRLLRLPSEIKQKIWKLAVTVDEPLTPVQLRKRSNKFVWSKSQHRFGIINASAAPPLVAVQLSQVCRMIYQEVAGTHLFYKVNHFNFQEYPAYAVDYLVAITAPRMNSIRSISCLWQCWDKPALLFTMIAACQNLQNLEVGVDWSTSSHLQSENLFLVPGLSRLAGFKELSMACQGLKWLTIDVANIPTDEHRLAIASSNATKTFCEELEPLLLKLMTKPGGRKYSLATFKQAQGESNLDVHGEGRLGEDKKPGVVASRTRQQIRNLGNIRADGTVPERPVPKYNLNGDLAWLVDEIFSSRETNTDDDVIGVEFLVKCVPMGHRGNVGETNWEDLSTLTSIQSRTCVSDFYLDNPEAYGKELVLAAWDIYGKKDFNRLIIKKMISREHYLLQDPELSKVNAEARKAAQ